ASKRSNSSGAGGRRRAATASRTSGVSSSNGPGRWARSDHRRRAAGWSIVLPWPSARAPADDAQNVPNGEPEGQPAHAEGPLAGTVGPAGGIRQGRVRERLSAGADAPTPPRGASPA